MSNNQIQAQILENVALGNDLTPNQVGYLKSLFDVNVRDVVPTLAAHGFNDGREFEHGEDNALTAIGIDEQAFMKLQFELNAIANEVRGPLSKMIEAIGQQGSNDLVAYLILSGLQHCRQH